MEKIVEENHTFHAPYLRQSTLHATPSQASFKEHTPSYNDYSDSFQDYVNDFGDNISPTLLLSTHLVPLFNFDSDSDNASIASKLPENIDCHIKDPYQKLM